jgi:hypothetical protein
MPRYYLHLHDTIDAIDQEGIVLPSLEAAYAEAITGLRDVIAGQVRDGRLATHSCVEIVSQSGENLGTVTFMDAIEIEASHPLVGRALGNAVSINAPHASHD